MARLRVKQAIGINARTWTVNPLAGPVALVSTVDRLRHVNIAPQSWISFVSANPFIIALGCDRRHHTAQNLLAMGECVLNFPGDDLAEQVWQAASFRAPGPGEPDARGFTPLPSTVVRPPRLAECRAHIECRVESVKEYGEGRVFLLEAVAASADTEAFTARDPYAYLRPMFYLTEGTYGVVERGARVTPADEGKSRP